MTNKKLDHLENLVAYCSDLQQQLLAQPRKPNTDNIIVNLFNLVIQCPHISTEQLYQSYQALLKVDWEQAGKPISINDNIHYTPRSLYHL